MESQAFTGGIKEGGLTTSAEVKFLICYVIEAMDMPVTFEQLYEAMSENVNYFEYSGAVGELCEAGSIIFEPTGNGKPTFKITEKGERAAREFKGSIPFTVREETLKAADEIIRQKKIREENLVSYTKVEDGYMLSITIKDFGSDLLGMKVFLPTEKECMQIEQRFLKDPLIVYRGVIELLVKE